MNSSIFDQIYTLLDEYFGMSDSILSKGFPWAVILSLHEVYRHLYPTEPYIEDYSVEDKDKPQYILNLLKKQCEFYSVVAGSVIPYKTLSLENIPDLYSVSKNMSTEVATGTLYGNLWENFALDDIIEEGKKLIQKRINSPNFSLTDLEDKIVLDLGCGSGRYTIALNTYGCKTITGYDVGDQGLDIGKDIVKKYGLKNIKFVKGDVLNLPYEDETFDFVFCNGVLHHTKDFKRGLSELYRVLKSSRTAFLYVYADGGLFWNFRKKAREVTCKVPREYARQVLNVLGLPSNRFIFMDTWYVPIERHTSKEELEDILLNDIGFKSIEKLISRNETDLDFYIAAGRPYARELYGDGEHRYLLYK